MFDLLLDTCHSYGATKIHNYDMYSDLLLLFFVVTASLWAVVSCTEEHLLLLMLIASVQFLLLAPHLLLAILLCRVEHPKINLHEVPLFSNALIDSSV